MVLVVVVSVMANRALQKKQSRLKDAFLNIIGFLEKYIVDSFADKAFARSFFPLIVGVFFIILFGNLFGLMIDWLAFAFDGSHIEEYMRPIHSDLNTTLVLGLITVVVFLGISAKYVGTVKTVKGYICNFSGHSIVEKCINVFVGWLHLIGVPATVASLSLRLFGNIFAGMVLISVISFLGATMTEALGIYKSGTFLSLPFWFFEIFVAFIQAAVFAGLMIAYFGQSKEDSH